MNVTLSKTANSDGGFDWFAIGFGTFVVGVCLAACYCIPKCGHRPPGSSVV